LSRHLEPNQIKKQSGIGTATMCTKISSFSVKCEGPVHKIPTYGVYVDVATVCFILVVLKGTTMHKEIHSLPQYFVCKSRGRTYINHYIRY